MYLGRKSHVQRPSHLSDEGPKKGSQGSRMSQEEEILTAVPQPECHFTSFIVSFDGLTGKEAETVLKFLAARTTNKAGNKYSNIMGYMRAHLSISIVRATHVCLRGSRVPTSRMGNIHP
jgi:hypothetical protein